MKQIILFLTQLVVSNHVQLGDTLRLAAGFFILLHIYARFLYQFYISILKMHGKRFHPKWNRKNYIGIRTTVLWWKKGYECDNRRNREQMGIVGRTIWDYVTDRRLERNGIGEHKFGQLLLLGDIARDFWGLFKWFRVHGNGDFSENNAARVSKMRHGDELQWLQHVRQDRLGQRQDRKVYLSLLRWNQRRRTGLLGKTEVGVLWCHKSDYPAYEASSRLISRDF